MMAVESFVVAKLLQYSLFYCFFITEWGFELDSQGPDLGLCWAIV